MFNIGEKIISKEKFVYKEEFLTIGKTYILSDIFNSLGSTWFRINDDDKTLFDLTLQEFEKCFLSKTEMRKRKLEKLNGKYRHKKNHSKFRF